MSISLLSMALLMALVIPAFSQPGTPMMTVVEPSSGKVGDVFVAQGSHIDETSVAALYLTDGKNDFKVLITEQTGTSIKFKIPAGVKEGHFALMVLTKGKDARY